MTQPERRAMRIQYIEHQKGLCIHCNAPLSGPPAKHIQAKAINLKLFPPNFLKHPIHLHHNHSTGMTIGAIHARCNAYLWQYRGE